MANIPRFDANIQSISVPRMKDYEYEQNVSIYKTLKAAGERINNTFFELVAEGSIGKPNEDYGTAVKNYETAVANNRPQQEIQEAKQKMQQTPKMRWGWF